MSREAVSDRICLAGPNTECQALRMLGVVAARITNSTSAWAHAGILYRSKKEIRFFELRTHRKLTDEPIKDDHRRPSIVWVEPRIQPERATLVIAKCRLVMKHYKENTLPYGFRYSRTSFDEHGTLHLGSSEVGLTCATIVDAVFTSEGLRLLDPSKWPPPDDEDKRLRRAVIADIRTRDPEHAALLEAEIDAPRIRPEEVVAAAAIHPTVGTFDTLLDGAAVVAASIGL